MAGVAAAFVILTAVLVHAVPGEDVLRIRDLVEAGSAAAARSLLADWPALTFQSFSFLLGFDLLYDIVHNNTVALFAIWGARRSALRAAAIVASIVAWVMWLDTALNLFENLAFLHIVRGGDPAPVLAIASAVFNFRTGTLTVGLLLGIGLPALAFGRRPAATLG